jgi:hypothetical protein
MQSSLSKIILRIQIRTSSDVVFDGFNVSFQATINTHTTDSKGFANLRIALVLAMSQLHLLIFAA